MVTPIVTSKSAASVNGRLHRSPPRPPSPATIQPACVTFDLFNNSKATNPPLFSDTETAAPTVPPHPSPSSSAARSSGTLEFWVATYSWRQRLTIRRRAAEPFDVRSTSSEGIWSSPASAMAPMPPATRCDTQLPAPTPLAPARTSSPLIRRSLQRHRTDHARRWAPRWTLGNTKRNHRHRSHQSADVTISGGNSTAALFTDQQAARQSSFAGLNPHRRQAHERATPITDKGTLTLTDCTLSGNSSSGVGGAISVSGNLTLVNCTMTSNTTRPVRAARIEDGGSVTVLDSTLSGNRSRRRQHRHRRRASIIAAGHA